MVGDHDPKLASLILNNTIQPEIPGFSEGDCIELISFGAYLLLEGSVPEETKGGQTTTHPTPHVSKRHFWGCAPG
jgi:hypothetical protein